MEDEPSLGAHEMSTTGGDDFAVGYFGLFPSYLAPHVEQASGWGIALLIKSH